MRLHTSSGRGFTLIELLVVIAIIGVLSSVVLASLNTARAKSRDASRQAALRSIMVALELYYDKYGAYPASNSSSNTWVRTAEDIVAITPLIRSFSRLLPKDSFKRIMTTLFQVTVPFSIVARSPQIVDRDRAIAFLFIWKQRTTQTLLAIPMRTGGV